MSLSFFLFLVFFLTFFSISLLLMSRVFLFCSSLFVVSSPLSPPSLPSCPSADRAILSASLWHVALVGCITSVVSEMANRRDPGWRTQHGPMKGATRSSYQNVKAPKNARPERHQLARQGGLAALCGSTTSSSAATAWSPRAAQRPEQEFSTTPNGNGMMTTTLFGRTLLL